MEISSFASSSSKLLDALDKMGTSFGSDLKSTGPSGSPNAELVKEFEMAVQEVDLEGLENKFDEQNLMGDGGQNFQENDLTKDNAIENIDGETINFEKVNQTQKSDQVDLDLEGDATEKVEAGNNQANSNHDYEKDFLEILKKQENSPKVDQANQAENNSENKSKELNSEEILKEIQEIVKNIGNGNISHAELLRVQYLTAMFSFQVKSGNKATQLGAQGFEQVLKQQG